jgi:hypothetical protein
MLSTGKPAARIDANAESTVDRFWGRTAALASWSSKLCTPMLIRVAPRSASTASRSGVAVSGDVSTDNGTCPSRTPIAPRIRSSSRANS